MNFGLPIIEFEQSGSIDNLEDDKYGILVENGNIEELINKLNLLINNISIMEEYQNLSLKRVKNFDLEHITSK